jgi:hypothetical protein
MKVNNQEAYEFVLLKWERIVRRLELNEKTPKEIFAEVCLMDDLKIFMASCAYCELYRINGCNECPLCINNMICFNDEHPYYKFTSSCAINNTQYALKYAIKLLNLIRETKPKEEK